MSASNQASTDGEEISNQPSTNIHQQSGNVYGNPYFDHVPYPNALFTSPSMEWTNQPFSYRPYLPGVAPQQQPILYQQQYPVHQPWLTPTVPLASSQIEANPSLMTFEAPNVYYDPGSFERNAFSLETESLEPISDATSFLRGDSVASVNIYHYHERSSGNHPLHNPPFPGDDPTSAATIHPPPGHFDELSLQDLDFPDDDDDDLSIIGGPRTEV